MFLAFATAAAAGAAADNDPTVAIIGAIGAMIVSIVTALGIYIKSADARADRLNTARVDDAVAGETQLRKERDEANERTNRAYKERDRWMEMWATEQARANKLEVRLAVCEKNGTQDPTGAGR
jgi:hypothetical protein